MGSRCAAVVLYCLSLSLPLESPVTTIWPPFTSLCNSALFKPCSHISFPLQQHSRSLLFTALNQSPLSLSLPTLNHCPFYCPALFVIHCCSVFSQSIIQQCRDDNTRSSVSIRLRAGQTLLWFVMSELQASDRRELDIEYTQNQWCKVLCFA